MVRCKRPLWRDIDGTSLAESRHGLVHKEPTMSVLWQDLKYGARMLRKKPGFTAVALLTLALGIGANTALYSVVQAVVLRPLPYKEAERLAVPISFRVAQGPGDGGVISYADYLDWKTQGVFQHVAVIDNTLDHVDLSGGDGEPERVSLAIVSEDYFTVLGAAPMRGRLFGQEDYAVRGAQAVVIAGGLWKRRYGGDPGIVGTKIYLNGRPYPVIGVVDERLTWPERREVFLPMAMGGQPDPGLLRRDNMLFLALARLKAGSSFEQTDAVLAGMARRLEHEHPESRAGW